MITGTGCDDVNYKLNFIDQIVRTVLPAGPEGAPAIDFEAVSEGCDYATRVEAQRGKRRKDRRAGGKGTLDAPGREVGGGERRQARAEEEGASRKERRERVLATDRPNASHLAQCVAIRRNREGRSASSRAPRKDVPSFGRLFSTRTYVRSSSCRIKTSVARRAFPGSARRSFRSRLRPGRYKTASPPRVTPFLPSSSDPSFTRPAIASGGFCAGCCSRRAARRAGAAAAGGVAAELPPPCRRAICSPLVRAPPLRQKRLRLRAGAAPLRLHLRALLRFPAPRFLRLDLEDDLLRLDEIEREPAAVVQPLPASAPAASPGATRGSVRAVRGGGAPDRPSLRSRRRAPRASSSSTRTPRLRASRGVSGLSRRGRPRPSSSPRKSFSERRRAFPPLAPAPSAPSSCLSSAGRNHRRGRVCSPRRPCPSSPRTSAPPPRPSPLRRLLGGRHRRPDVAALHAMLQKRLPSV